MLIKWLFNRKQRSQPSPIGKVRSIIDGPSSSEIADAFLSGDSVAFVTAPEDRTANYYSGQRIIDAEILSMEEITPWDDDGEFILTIKYISTIYRASYYPQRRYGNLIELR